MCIQREKAGKRLRVVKNFSILSKTVLFSTNTFPHNKLKRLREREREKRRRKAREEDTSSVVVVVIMDVPDDWGIVANDDDDDDGKKKRWLTPNTTAARNHLVEAKTTNEKKEKGEEREREQSEGKVISGRLLGRRRRAKEKRKRMATNRKTTRKNDGGGSSADEEEEEKEEKEEEKRERRTNANMTEKQKKKAEKNRARKLRREWKRKKEMEEEEEEEEKKARVGHNPDEEERNEMKRLAKEYVAEKAKKKRAKITTTKGEEKHGNRSNSNSESSEKNEDEGEEFESEDDVAQQRREREREREREQEQQPAVKKQKKLSLIDKMRAKLSGGHFRMLNEQLYTTKGDEALHLVQQNPGVFDAYHEGFREQVKKWPKNPVHKCFEWLQHKPYDTIIADFGCGDAELAKLIGKSKKKVYSLDLETPSHAPFVIACNMAKTPLESNSVDVAVFSLSLMGTDYYKFIEEASRVLKVKGKLWIAEVKSRFDGRNGAASIPSFVASLKTAGFDVDPKKVDEKDKMFFVLEAVKAKNHASSSSGGGEKNNNKSGKVEWPKLRACEYKKR